MDRPNPRQGVRAAVKSLMLIPVAGSLVVLTGAGCSSFHHRGKLPPAPRAVRDGSGVGFSSEPSPLQSAQGGVIQPSGPLSPYGPAGNYGGAPGGNEPTSAPLGNAPLGEPAPGVGGEAPVGGDVPPKPF